MMIIIIISVTSTIALFARADTGDNSVLRQVVIDIVASSTCNRTLLGYLTDSMMCAGSVGGKNSCYGDAGGPLVCKQGDQWLQYGVVSFGITESCASPTYPSIYANVVNLLPWIEQKTGRRYPHIYRIILCRIFMRSGSS